MRKQAAKGRSLLSLAALLSLIAAVLVAPSASASRYLLDLLPVPPTTPSVEQPQAAGQPPPTFALLTAQERLALDPDAHPEQVTVRWRRSYLPGASGLDDAVQVRIEEAASGSDTLYTLLRDELGSVIGLIEEPVALEDEELPAIPPLVARYLYTPFGEARVETALELASARLDPDRTMVEVDGARSRRPSTIRSWRRAGHFSCASRRRRAWRRWPARSASARHRCRRWSRAPRWSQRPILLTRRWS